MTLGSGRLETRGPLGFEARRENDPLGEFLVDWIGLSESDQASELEAAVDAARDERAVQLHLEAHPRVLAQVLTGGHGRWVIPQKRLGERFIPDFVLGHRWSGPTWEWVLVELQTPVLRSGRNRHGRLFTKTGRMSEQLDEGLRQINEWRLWLADNIDYAKRSRQDNGLGLTGVMGNSPGLLLIGREADLTPEHAARRKQLGEQHNVKIHSYDWLVREARARVQ